MTKGDIACGCFADGKLQDTKCESVKTEGNLSIYKVYCATCNSVLDIVYHGTIENSIVSVVATS